LERRIPTCLNPLCLSPSDSPPCNFIQPFSFFMVFGLPFHHGFRLFFPPSFFAVIRRDLLVPTRLLFPHQESAPLRLAHCLVFSADRAPRSQPGPPPVFLPLPSFFSRVLFPPCRSWPAFLSLLQSIVAATRSLNGPPVVPYRFQPLFLLVARLLPPFLFAPSELGSPISWCYVPISTLSCRPKFPHFSLGSSIF